MPTGRDLDQGLKLDKDLTNIALGYFEGLDPSLLQICPVLKVPGNGKYPSFARGAWKYTSQEGRARYDDNVPKIDWPTESWTDYTLEEFPMIGAVDRLDRGKSTIQGMVYSSEEAATQAVVDTLMRGLHSRIASQVTSTSVITGYATPATKWNASGATPFDDLQTYIAAFESACGVTPNGLVIPTNVMRHLGEGLRAKYGVTTQVSNTYILKEMALPDLGMAPGSMLIVPTGMTYGTSSYSALFGSNVLFFYTTPGKPNGWTPTLGNTLVNEETDLMKVLTPYDSPNKTQTYVQVIFNYRVAILNVYAGYLGYSVLA